MDEIKPDEIAPERWEVIRQLVAAHGDPAIAALYQPGEFFFVFRLLSINLRAPAAEWNALVARLGKVPPDLTAKEREEHAEVMAMTLDSMRRRELFQFTLVSSSPVELSVKKLSAMS